MLFFKKYSPLVNQVYNAAYILLHIFLINHDTMD